MTLSITEATDDEFPYVHGVLREVGLPTAGLGDASVRLYLAEDDGERVGVGGYERYGETGLLRSIAIVPSAQDGGLGSDLVSSIEDEAAGDGIRRFVLLTTDAAPFFRGLGYESADWSAQPADLRETSALAAVCPDSAACLEKRL